jgi:phosphatidylglycerophosphatase C
VEESATMTDEPRPIVAAFDLDGTLTEDGSVFKWLRAVAGSVRVVRSTLFRLVTLAWGGLRSGEAADRVKERLFTALLAGRAERDVRSTSGDFGLDHLARAGREDVIDRLRWHVRQGHHVVVVSASPELYVEVIATALGAHGAVATRLATDPLGRLTGGYLGRNCRGEEKLRRLQLWVRDRGVLDEYELHAYGNSRGDRRMLAAADVAVDCGHLGRLGALGKFTRLRSLEAPEAAVAT